MPGSTGGTSTRKAKTKTPKTGQTKPRRQQTTAQHPRPRLTTRTNMQQRQQGSQEGGKEPPAAAAAAAGPASQNPASGAVQRARRTPAAAAAAVVMAAAAAAAAEAAATAATPSVHTGRKVTLSTGPMRQLQRQRQQQPEAQPSHGSVPPSAETSGQLGTAPTARPVASNRRPDMGAESASSAAAAVLPQLNHQPGAHMSPESEAARARAVRLLSASLLRRMPKPQQHQQQETGAVQQQQPQHVSTTSAAEHLTAAQALPAAPVATAEHQAQPKEKQKVKQRAQQKVQQKSQQRAAAAASRGEGSQTYRRKGHEQVGSRTAPGSVKAQHTSSTQPGLSLPSYSKSTSPILPACSTDGNASPAAATPRGSSQPTLQQTPQGQQYTPARPVHRLATATNSHQTPAASGLQLASFASPAAGGQQSMPQPPPQQQQQPLHKQLRVGSSHGSGLSLPTVSTGLLQAVQQPSTGLCTLQLGLLARNTQIPAMLAPAQTVRSACRTVTGQYTQLLPGCSTQPATLQPPPPQQQHNGHHGRSMASVVSAPYPTEQLAGDGQEGKQLTCSDVHAILQGWMLPYASCWPPASCRLVPFAFMPERQQCVAVLKWHHHAIANIKY